MSTKIQVRRGTATEWATANTVLAQGEFGYDTTNKILKIGDGTTAWPNLNSANVPVMPGFVSGAYYRSPNSHATTAVSFSPNVLYATPFCVSYPVTLQSIGITSNGVTTAGNARFGIYTDSNGAPGSLVSGSEVSIAISTSTGNVEQAGSYTTNLKLPTGWYWLAAVLQGAVGSWYGTTATSALASFQRQVLPTSGNAAVNHYEKTGTSGSLPTTFNATDYKSTAGLAAWVRVA